MIILMLFGTVISERNYSDVEDYECEMVPQNRKGRQISNYFNKWSVSSGQNGKIIIPWAVEQTFPQDPYDAVKRALHTFSQDLTCIDFWNIERKDLSSLDLQSNRWMRDQGLLYIWENVQTTAGCYAKMGQEPGISKYTGGSMEAAGVPWQWQEVGLKTGCTWTAAKILHETLHALGWHHEHCRVDRDNHLNINWGNIRDGKNHNFVKINQWNEYGARIINFEYPLEFRSIMMYTGKSFSRNNNPTITLKNGNGYTPSDIRHTTTDAMEVNDYYCDGEQPHDVGMCNVLDEQGINRPILYQNM